MKFLKKLKGIKFKYRLNSVVLVAGVIVVAILLNVVISALATKVPLKIDVTKNNLFELTEETKRLLSELDKEVSVYYLTQGGQVQQIEETLKMYQTASNKIKFENIDVVADPLFAAKYKEKGVDATVGSVLVEYGDRVKLIEAMDMFEIGYTAQGTQGVSGFKLEQKLTNAINYVISDSKTFVYFTTGHGEIGYSTVAPILEDENITTAELDLKTADIPGNAAALYILGPQADFSADEINRLDAYLSKGGKLNVTFDVTAPETSNIYKYLNEFWGVTVNRDIIFETDSSMIIQSTPIYLLPNLVSHAITDSVIASDVDVMWPSSMSFNTKTTPGVSYASLVESSSSAISRNVNAESITQAQEDDRVGKHTLALAVTRTFPQMPETKIVICGTTQFYATSFLAEGSVSNRNLLYGILRYLVDEDTSVLSIAPKNLEISALGISNAQASVYAILFGALPAVIVLGAGLWVWIRRRHL